MAKESEGAAILNALGLKRALEIGCDGGAASDPWDKPPKGHMSVAAHTPGPCACAHMRLVRTRRHW